MINFENDDSYNFSSSDDCVKDKIEWIENIKKGKYIRVDFKKIFNKRSVHQKKSSSMNLPKIELGQKIAQKKPDVPVFIDDIASILSPHENRSELYHPRMKLLTIQVNDTNYQSNRSCKKLIQTPSKKK